MWLEQTGGGIEGVVCETSSAGCRVWLVPSDGRCGVHMVGAKWTSYGLHKYATQYLRPSHLGLNVNRNISFSQKGIL